MATFYIFYSARNDPRKFVRVCDQTAREAARKAGIQLNVKRINIDKGVESDLKKYFSGSTVECVTVADDIKKDSEVNPNKNRIVEMIMDLKEKKSDE